MTAIGLFILNCEIAVLAVAFVALAFLVRWLWRRK
jgi:hypothetical protein